MEASRLEKITPAEIRKLDEAGRRDMKSALREEIVRSRMHVAMRKEGSKVSGLSKMKKTMARLLTVETELAKG